MSVENEKTLKLIQGDRVEYVILAPSRNAGAPRAPKNPWQPRLCVTDIAHKMILQERTAAFGVYFYLMQYIDMNNWVQGMSVERIARAVDKSERTVNKAIDRLLDMEVILVTTCARTKFWFNPSFFIRMKKWNESKDQLEMRWKARLEYLNEQNDLTRSA